MTSTADVVSAVAPPVDDLSTLREVLRELVAADDALKAAQRAWCEKYPVGLNSLALGVVAGGYPHGETRGRGTTSFTVQVPDPEMHAASERLGRAWAAARALAGPSLAAGATARTTSTQYHLSVEEQKALKRAGLLSTTILPTPPKDQS